MNRRNLKQQTDGMVGDYPKDWPQIAKRVKDEAGWKCERCGEQHNRLTAHVLTVAHLIPDKSLCERWNLAALCQRCHLSTQGKIDMAQGWMLGHSAWMKPHVEGYEAWKRGIQ